MGDSKKAARMCSKCGTNPAGRGGILCPGCKEKIEAVTRPENAYAQIPADD